MIVLTEPEERYLSSYRSACEEYRDKGIEDYSFTDPDSCDIFEKFDNYRHARNLKPNRVGSDYYWLVDTDKNLFIGEITLRHELSEALRICGGHIGYGVRYGYWNRGYASMMVSFVLERAKQLGLERVLITCDDRNGASARVAEKSGFLLEDKVEYTEHGEKLLIRRYWKTIP